MYSGAVIAAAMALAFAYGHAHASREGLNPERADPGVRLALSTDDARTLLWELRDEDLSPPLASLRGQLEERLA
jgi:hypothetical protein